MVRMTRELIGALPHEDQDGSLYFNCPRDGRLLRLPRSRNRDRQKTCPKCGVTWTFRHTPFL
jgi:uncharacterized C2H2 Zn-finger protein